MNRFLVLPEDVEAGRITIKGREVHHLRNVLRLGKGERVICFDGRGRTYQGRIEELSSAQVEIRIGKMEKPKKEPPVRITLAQSLIRANKMDLIVQKGTELGVFKIIPLRTERCLIKLDDLKSKGRQERWQRLTIEAAKQCGIAQLPKIEDVKDFTSVLKTARDFDLGIIAWEEENKEKSFREALRKRPSPPRDILLLIGPEGGFSGREVAEAKKAGLLSISLGANVLRAETAAIAATAILAYELGY